MVTTREGEIEAGEVGVVVLVARGGGGHSWEGREGDVYGGGKEVWERHGRGRRVAADVKIRRGWNLR